MKRISKKTRDEAALICSVLASTRSGIWSDEVADYLGLTDEATALAELAWDHVRFTVGIRSAELTNSDAEAESLLRTGWSPS